MKLDALLQLDPLTQLPNRAGWMQATRLALEAAESKEQKAILFIDLDRFKWVNDTLGHEAGDELLLEVAHRLLDQVDVNATTPDLIGRLGGDEFVALIQAPESIQKVAVLAQGIIDALSETIPLKAGEADIGASIGISRFPQDGSDMDTLLGHADLAMYRAKHSGRNQFVMYHPEMTRQIQRRQVLQSRIREALRQGRFQLAYQPVYASDSEQVVALTSLPTSDVSELMELDNEALYSISDESQLGVKFSQWILSSALDQLQEMNASGLEIPLIVEMRPGHFQQPNLVDWLEVELEKREVSAEQLILALNERCLNVQRFPVHQQLSALDKLGCSLAIMDFASGQWSLERVHDWPISQLHLSAVFVQKMLRNRSFESLSEAVLNLGQTLNKIVVALGVSAADQQAFLNSYGCDWLSGEWLGQTLDASEVIEELAQARNHSRDDYLNDELYFD